mgnify:CR=1 FL=1
MVAIDTINSHCIFIRLCMIIQRKAGFSRRPKRNCSLPMKKLLLGYGEKYSRYLRSVTSLCPRKMNNYTWHLPNCSDVEKISTFSLVFLTFLQIFHSIGTLFQFFLYFCNCICPMWLGCHLRMTELRGGALHIRRRYRVLFLCIRTTTIEMRTRTLQG